MESSTAQSDWRTLTCCLTGACSRGITAAKVFSRPTLLRGGQAEESLLRTRPLSRALLEQLWRVCTSRNSLQVGRELP